jgi:hypothetical protein
VGTSEGEDEGEDEGAGAGLGVSDGWVADGDEAAPAPRPVTTTGAVDVSATTG